MDTLKFLTSKEYNTIAVKLLTDFMYDLNNLTNYYNHWYYELNFKNYLYKNSIFIIL